MTPNVKNNLEISPRKKHYPSHEEDIYAWEVYINTLIPEFIFGIRSKVVTVLFFIYLFIESVFTTLKTASTTRR
jgi:hypothetical protein